MQTAEKMTENPKDLRKKRRQREREQRYQTILDAAEYLFAQNGYHQASIEQIADRAEVSVGAVYFYFKNKEDLLIKLLDDIGYQIRNRLGMAFRNTNISLDTFKQAGRIFFEEICLQNPDRIKIFLRESVGQSSMVEAHRKKVFDRLIDDARKALLQMPPDPPAAPLSELTAEVIAVSIMGMFERIAYQYLIWQDRTADLGQIGRDAMNFISGGIGELKNLK